MTETQKSTKNSAIDKTAKVFSDAERSAIQARAEEQKAARRGTRAGKADGERDVLAKIAEMPEADRTLAERLHSIIKASAPDLESKTWYGMPSYARDGKVVCFFQGGYKFNTRYAMLGFNDSANLDDGHVWPVYFALTELTDADEPTISKLLKQAVSEPRPHLFDSKSKFLARTYSLTSGPVRMAPLPFVRRGHGTVVQWFETLPCPSLRP